MEWLNIALFRIQILLPSSGWLKLYQRSIEASQTPCTRTLPVTPQNRDFVSPVRTAQQNKAISWSSFIHISHNLSFICYYCFKVIVFAVNSQIYAVNASAADVPCLRILQYKWYSNLRLGDRSVIERI